MPNTVIKTEKAKDMIQLILWTKQLHKHSNPKDGYK